MVLIFITIATFLNNNLVEDVAFKQKFLSKELALTSDVVSYSNAMVSVDMKIHRMEEINLDTRNGCQVSVDLERAKCSYTKDTIKSNQKIKGDSFIMEGNNGAVRLNDRG